MTLIVHISNQSSDAASINSYYVPIKLEGINERKKQNNKIKFEKGENSIIYDNLEALPTKVFFKAYSGDSYRIEKLEFKISGYEDIVKDYVPDKYAQYNNNINEDGGYILYQSSNGNYEKEVVLNWEKQDESLTENLPEPLTKSLSNL